MSPRFPRVTGKEMIRFLKSRGFEVVRIKGSHHVLKNHVGITVVIPVHGKEELGIGLINKILSQSHIPAEDFISFFRR